MDMKWKKSGLVVLMTALLAMVGLPVSAQETLPAETGAEEAVSLEMEESILPDADATAGIIASGKDGDVTWVIDGNGKLTVEGTGDLSPRNYKSDDFAWRPYGSQITSAEINVSGMTDASCLFYGCSNMTSVDLKGFDTSSVTNMDHMFGKCNNLTSLDVSGFDTSNVTNMYYMFGECNNLTSLDVSGFDTSSVTNMSFMFSLCKNLTSLNLSSFDTSKVIYMDCMFQRCEKITSLGKH